MTDGILLAELTGDRDLPRYDTLIIDEAHERSLNIDFILGYLTQLLPRRPDLKVVITSATIDTERFAAALRDGGQRRSSRSAAARTPSRSATGPSSTPTTPRPTRTATRSRPSATPSPSCSAKGPATSSSSSPASARSATPRTRWPSANFRNTEILPLYARLTTAEQHRVFAPHPGNRIVLATNVAETSLTVPGIRYVVDTGLARISRYSRRLKVQRLPIEKVSQASANQRAGRCGRVADGICIRLYAEDDFDARPEFTDPEILRTNLASVILQMIALDLGDLAAFPFVDKPDLRAVGDGLALLNELGALDARAPAADGGRARARRRCPSTRGWAACSSRPTGRAACARCWSSPRRCRCRTRASGPTEQRQAADAEHAPLRPGRLGLPRLPQALGATCRSSAPRSPATGSAGCCATSSCTSCASASGRTCTASCARPRATPG